MSVEDWDDTSERADDLRIVRLCYKYALLRSRAATLTADELEEMKTLEDLLVGDPRHARRAFRRITTLLPASIRSDGEPRHGLLLNVSPAGMYVALGSPLHRGAVVDVELNCPDGDSYVFTGVVRHVARDGQLPGAGLSLTRAAFLAPRYHNNDNSPSA